MTNDNKKVTKHINSNKVTVKNVGLKKKILKRVGQVTLSLVSAAFVIGSAGAPAGAINATETAQAVSGSEGGKEMLNQVLKVARAKPALSIAAGIACAACLPAAGATVSPSLCIACGILMTKVIG